MKTATKPKPTPAELLKAAEKEAAKATSWMDFSNFLFNPDTGLITAPFSPGAERKRFMKTKEYKAIHKLLEEVQNRTGFNTDLKAPKSGRFVVRLPISLHAALVLEAAREGVSLNQLAVAKLAFQIGLSQGKREDQA